MKYTYTLDRYPDRFVERWLTADGDLVAERTTNRDEHGFAISDQVQVQVHMKTRS